MTRNLAWVGVLGHCLIRDDTAQPITKAPATAGNTKEIPMKRKELLTKTLAIAGTALVWFPLLAPLLLSVASVTQGQMFRFDYLMPAELFPSVLVGGGLLFWAALRARSRHGLVGWGLGIAAGLLVGGQVLAVATGLASGKTEPAGWQWTLVFASIVAYSLTLAAIGVGGVLLLRDLFGPLASDNQTGSKLGQLSHGNR
jgi:hypothetical protein